MARQRWSWRLMKKGQPIHGAQKRNCTRSYKLDRESGLPGARLIFDPNVLTVATGMEERNNYAVILIESLAGLNKRCPRPVSGGLATSTFRFRGNKCRPRSDAFAFLFHAIKAGLDMAHRQRGMLPCMRKSPKDLLELVEGCPAQSPPDARAARQVCETVKNRTSPKRSKWSGAGHRRAAPGTRAGQGESLISSTSDVEEGAAEIGPAPACHEGPLMAE